MQVKAKTILDCNILVILQPWIPAKKPKRRDENIYKISTNGQREGTRYADETYESTNTCVLAFVAITNWLRPDTCPFCYPHVNGVASWLLMDRGTLLIKFTLNSTPTQQLFSYQFAKGSRSFTLLECHIWDEPHNAEPAVSKIIRITRLFTTRTPFWKWIMLVCPPNIFLLDRILLLCYLSLLLKSFLKAAFKSTRSIGSSKESQKDQARPHPAQPLSRPY